MSEIKLLTFTGDMAAESPGSGDNLEKTLQATFEKNRDTLIGIRFLAIEHSTGKTHTGLIAWAQGSIVLSVSLSHVAAAMTWAALEMTMRGDWLYESRGHMGGFEACTTVGIWALNEAVSNHFADREWISEIIGCLIWYHPCVEQLIPRYGRRKAAVHACFHRAN